MRFATDLFVFIFGMAYHVISGTKERIS